jgi:hypothetical protein
MNHWPTETRGGSPFALLAEKTGLSEGEIAAIADRGELRQLLIDKNVLRAGRGRDPRQLIVDLQAKRHPPVPKSARQALVEILARRWPEDGPR